VPPSHDCFASKMHWFLHAVSQVYKCVKSYSLNSRDHCTCCLLSFLVVVKYSRFLWSIRILNFNWLPCRQCCHS
jgi:hypothetical protein